jgi:hypothetical protein
MFLSEIKLVSELMNFSMISSSSRAEEEERRQKKKKSKGK